MYVLSVDDTAKTITIKFPGAVSGSYNLSVSTTADGRLDSGSLNLEVIGEITNFSPLEASSAGGTLVTITGRHFSTVLTDNPVTLGGAGSQGNIECTVLTSSDT